LHRPSDCRNRRSHGNPAHTNQTSREGYRLQPRALSLGPVRLKTPDPRPCFYGLGPWELRGEGLWTMGCRLWGARADQPRRAGRGYPSVHGPQPTVLGLPARRASTDGERAAQRLAIRQSLCWRGVLASWREICADAATLWPLWSPWPPREILLLLQASGFRLLLIHSTVVRNPSSKPTSGS
jgi:hypothetical protein